MDLIIPLAFGLVILITASVGIYALSHFAASLVALLVKKLKR